MVFHLFTLNTQNKGEIHQLSTFVITINRKDKLINTIRRTCQPHYEYHAAKT